MNLGICKCRYLDTKILLNRSTYMARLPISVILVIIQLSVHENKKYNNCIDKQFVPFEFRTDEYIFHQ